MRRTLLLALGFLALAVAWISPLPVLARHAFAAHMSMHMLVVAVAAPLLAAGAARSRIDPVRWIPRLLAPIPLSIVELLVVWTWHAPAFHHAARSNTAALVLEQTTFLISGLLVWFAAVGGDRDANRTGAGIVALLLTSMHMTLLGALLALAPRPLFSHGQLADQHLGGAIMLVAGGASYLLGGLSLTFRLIRRTAERT